jgi:hypothetical protein
MRKEKFLCVLIFLFSLNAYSQSSKKTLSNVELSKLIPEKIKGFYLSGKSKCTQTKIGTLNYALCERTFVKKKQTIKILLFDYKEAEIMFNQSTHKWTNANKIENDSLIFRPFNIANVTGWESYRKASDESQFLLAISNRFYLTITAGHTTLEDLRPFLENFNFEKYPL